MSCTLMSTKMPPEVGANLHEEAGRVVLVAGLRAHQERPADRAGGDALVRVLVARVEAAHEADHHLRDADAWRPRPRPRGIRRAPSTAAFRRTRACRPCSAAMICAGCSVFGVTRKTASMSWSARADRRSPCTGPATPSVSRAQSSSSPIGLHAATSAAPGTRVREVLGMAAAHAADADDADADRRCVAMRSSVRAPRSLLAPRCRRGVGELQRLRRRPRSTCAPVVPFASASKKCAISSA